MVPFFFQTRCSTILSTGIKVLPSEIQHKGSKSPSIKSPVVDGENEARPLVGVSALSFLWCFNTLSWVTSSVSGP